MCDNHYAKFEYKEWIPLDFQITQTRHPLSISEGKNVYVQHPSKIKKYRLNVHKMVGAHLQCVNIHYVKFEYKGMNTFQNRLHKLGTS